MPGVASRSVIGVNASNLQDFLTCGYSALIIFFYCAFTIVSELSFDYSRFVCLRNSIACISNIMSEGVNGHSVKIRNGSWVARVAVKRLSNVNDTNAAKKFKKHFESTDLKNQDWFVSNGTKKVKKKFHVEESFESPKYCSDHIMEIKLPVCDVDSIVKQCEESQELILRHTKIDINTAEELADGISYLPSRFVFKELQLRNCGINHNILKILLNAIGRREVISLDLSANLEMNSLGLSKFIKNSQPKKLDLSECKLKWTHDLEKLFSGTKLQVKSLNVSHEGFVGTSLSKALVQIFSSRIQELLLVDSAITSQHLEDIVKDLPSKIHLKVLDVSGNDLDERSMTALAKIVTSAKSMERLSMSDCGLTASALEAFHSNVDAKVAETDLSDNDFREGTCWKEIVDTVKKLSSGTVWLSNCNIKHIKVFGKAAFDKVQIKRLHLGANPGIDPIEVGKLGFRWKLEELHLNNCGFQADDLKNFEKGLHGHILERLDISELAEIPSEEKLGTEKDMRRTGKVAKEVTFEHLKTDHRNGSQCHDM